MSLLFSFFIAIMAMCDSRQTQLHRDDNYNVKDYRDDTDEPNRAHFDVGEDDSPAITQDKAFVEGSVLYGSMLSRGYFPKERRKRVAKIISAAALIGARAVRRILKEARIIADSKDVMVYEKSGGYSQASMDFRSLIQAGKLVKKRMHTGVVGKVGKVGDRVVSLEPGDAHTQATLVITKPPTDMKQRSSVDVIMYKN